MSWWCIQTEAQREHMVRLLLMRDGFETYAPRIKYRGRISFLFPTYLFVGAREQFYSVLWTPGVVRLLMSGDRPAHLGAEVITEIHKRESRDGFVKLPAAREGLRKGQGVRVTKGSFAGHLGLYEGMSSRDRAKVLLELLGRKVSVEMAQSDISPLDVVAN
jgi:transcription antitermination factor NusG